MFSPDAAAPSSVPARNPRRRQRTGSEDSVAIRQNPKRIRRSGLTSETFEPPLAKRPNGHLNHLKEAALVNGHAHEPGSQSNGSADASSLAIRHRGVKKVDREKRSSKHDGSIELVRVNIYGEGPAYHTGLKLHYADEERELCRDAAGNDTRITSRSAQIRYENRSYRLL